MNIIFFSSDKYPPFRVDVVDLFARQMSGRGHKIHWVLQSEEKCKKRYRTNWLGNNVTVGPTDIGKKRIDRIRKGVLDFINDLISGIKINREKYDLIIAKDKFLSVLFLLLISKISGVKIIFWLSYPFPEHNIYAAIKRTARYPIIYLCRGIVYSFVLYKIIIPFSKHIFVQSQQMKKDILEKGFKDCKFTPVPMGIQIDKIPFFGYSNNDKKEKKAIVYLGTLIKERKPEFLLYVLKKIKEYRKDIRLIYIGGGEDPSDEENLYQQISLLRLEKDVAITGFLPQVEAWSYVKQASVCTSPFYPTKILNSTSPTKLIEYMAMGKAVVASEHPEQKLIIKESNAGLCVPYNADKFAEAIIFLMDNPEKCVEMGINGREYVEKYRNYKTISQFVEKKLNSLNCENSKS